MTADLKQLSAITALNNMMEKGYFCISTIRNVAEMLDIKPEETEAFRILQPLHCVHFNKMPEELRKAIPDLIRQCLSVEPTYRFDMPTSRRAELVQTVEHKAPRRALLGFFK